jgi:hypothetical protein
VDAARDGSADATVDADRPNDAAADAAKPKPKDAGVEGGAADAAPRPSAKISDASVSDASGDGSGGIAADAAPRAPGAEGPRDPASMIGMKSLVNTGPQNVVLLINMAAVRAHPIGSKLGPLLSSFHQWRDFIKGNEQSFDPIRDTDWILLFGPSLIHTERDAVIIRYNMTDEAIEAAMDIAGKNYKEGGDFDAGVAGVKAVLGHADNAPRVFMRPQSKLLAVVPPKNAEEFAKSLKAKGVNPKIRAGEAVRLIVRDPSRQVAIPGLKFPAALKELRLWVIPAADGSADVYAEGDCNPAEEATPIAEAMTKLIADQNVGFVQLGTGGLLNGVQVLKAEAGRIAVHVKATQKQMDTLLGTLGLLLGVEFKK